MRGQIKTLLLVAILMLNNATFGAIKISEETKIDVSSDYLNKTFLQIDKNEIQQEKDWKRNINLSQDLQKYTWNLTQKYQIDYDLVLAIMWAESNFNIKAYNKNTNGTIDRGLMQINSSNKEWANQMANKELDLKDPYDNILAGILILKSYEKAWLGKVESNILDQYIVNSYNMGVSGYIKAGCPERSYSTKILNKQNELKYT